MKEIKNFPKMHVSLYVSDIEATVDFYSRFFNSEASKVKSDYAKFILDEPALIISFVQNKEKVDTQFGHLGFQVETEQELKLRLELAKVKSISVLEEMGTNCCYANQDKFWVTDPDGYMWEVYLFHNDVQFNDPRFSSNQDKQACCTPEAPKVESKPKVALSEVGNCAPGSGCC